MAGVDRLGVADVACGVGVDSRSPTLAVLSNVRCEARLASAVNEAMLVVVLAGTDGQSTFTRSAIQHPEGGIDLGGVARMRGLGVDDQGMSIVGQHVADITQSAGLALGFLIQPGIGVGLAFVGVRAPRFALEVGRSVGGSSSSFLRRRLPLNVQAQYRATRYVTSYVRTPHQTRSTKLRLRMPVSRRLHGFFSST